MMLRSKTLRSTFQLYLVFLSPLVQCRITSRQTGTGAEVLIPIISHVQLEIIQYHFMSCASKISYAAAQAAFFAAVSGTELAGSTSRGGPRKYTETLFGCAEELRRPERSSDIASTLTWQDMLRSRVGLWHKWLACVTEQLYQYDLIRRHTCVLSLWNLHEEDNIHSVGLLHIEA